MSINLDNALEKIFDNFKKITPALVVVSIVSALILFLPKSIIEEIGIYNIIEFHKGYVWLIFLCSTTLIVAIALSPIIEHFRLKIWSKIAKIEQRKRVKKLNPQYKQIINEALKNADRTVCLDISSGDTIYLQSKGLLYVSPQVAFLAGRRDNKIFEKFVPPSWLIDLYNEEPELFEE